MRAWGAVVATPIMRWLHDLDGPVDQFNQTVVLQAPAGVGQAMSRPCCRPCWTGTARCACRSPMTAPASGRSMCPRPGRFLRVTASSRCRRCRPRHWRRAARGWILPPGACCTRCGFPSTGRLALIVHHLAVDAVSWRILVEDINIAWAASQQASRSPCRPGDVVRPLGQSARGHSRTGAVTALADTWRQVTAAAAVLPAVAPERDTYASAGQLSLSLDAELTRQVIGEVPAAFHAGCRTSC